ncbi:proteoglycan 4b [Rhinoraja longicauda]
MVNPQNLMKWQTILLIVSSMNLPVMIATQASCSGRCVSRYERRHVCNCDSECIRYDECCEDYRALCTSETSCSGRCYEKHQRGRKCQCDSTCVKYGDCCADFDANCGGENEKAKEIEGLTTINSIKFENGKDDPKILDKGIITTTRSPVDASKDTKMLDNGMTTPSVSEDRTIDSTMFVKIMATSPVPEPELKDSETWNNRMTTPVVPEDNSTDPKIPDKRMKTTNVPEIASTNSKILVKETTATTTVPEGGITDSMFLDKRMTTAARTKVTSIEPEISHARITMRAASEETSLVPGILDRGMTTYPTPEDGSNDSKIFDKELTAVPESDFLNSKIPNNRMTVPLVTKDVSNKSEPLSDRITTPSVPLDQSKKSRIRNKGTTAIMPKDVSMDSKILDKGTTANGSRISENGMSTSAPSAAVSMDTRILDKGMTSLSGPVTGPAENGNMVTKFPLPSVEPENQTTEKIQSYEDSLNDPDLCNKKPSDASTTLQNGTTYIFRGHLFWTISQQGLTLDHPRSITNVWGIPSPIDTVFTRCNCKGQTYFFKDEEYWRFQNGAMDSGYPRNIAAGFSGLNGKVTAALSVAAFNNRPETVYFFKRGGVYQKYVYQRSFSTCPRERAQNFAYQVVRQRHRRQAMVVIQKNRTLQKIDKLSVEMSIRKNWNGFPIRITSAISLPNPRLAERYQYYVLSSEKSYKVNPVNLKATEMKRSITKDLYECH